MTNAEKIFTIIISALDNLHSANGPFRILKFYRMTISELFLPLT